MTIEEVSSDVYRNVIREPYHIFAGATFNTLNKQRAERACYLLFKDSKYRLGIIGGIRDGAFLSPFSAPYGGFTPLYDDIKIQTIEEAVDLLDGWLKDKNVRTVRITLPPPMYYENYLAKLSNVFYRKGFKIENLELNFHFNLSKLTQEYAKNIWRNARKNLSVAFASDLVFNHCITLEQKKNSYDVIQQNRTARGKPLRMSWELVQATITVIPADFFLVANKDEQSIGAAVVFTVAPRIGLVIYWGDIPDFQHLKTMNFLSFKIFEYYKAKNYQVIDIGYSTEDSVPNYGLCEFKESLGCDLSPKITYTKIVS